MKVYYDKDADLSLIKGKKVTIVGYGSQGHAHAQNLSDSGVKVTVGLRKEGSSWSKAENAGLKVEEVARAVRGADVVMMLLPDETIPQVYNAEVAPNMKKVQPWHLHTASMCITTRWCRVTMWTSSWLHLRVQGIRYVRSTSRVAVCRR
jgi:ketol-acid reductoisomerase